MRDYRNYRFVGGPSHGRVIAVRDSQNEFVVAVNTEPIASYGTEPSTAPIKIKTIEYVRRNFFMNTELFTVCETVMTPLDMPQDEARRLWHTLSFNISP